MIKEDLEDEIANGVKTEEADQMTAAKTLRTDLTNKKTDLTEAIAADNAEIEAHEEEKADRTADLAADHEYLWSIKPDCTWVLNTFDERRTKRDTEIAGLRESIGLLEGAMEDANASGETVALNQKAAHPVFNDDAFGSLVFKH